MSSSSQPTPNSPRNSNNNSNGNGNNNNNNSNNNSNGNNNNNNSNGNNNNNNNNSNGNSNNSNGNNNNNNNNNNNTSDTANFLDCSNLLIADPSYNPLTDPSYNPIIVQYTTHEIIDAIGIEIVNDEGTDISGNVISHTTFTSTEPDKYDPNINENFVEMIETYDDVCDPRSQNAVLLNQIKEYASKIHCSDFHGKGTIDDYAELFNAAANIANESKQIQLDIDIDGFNEFSQAADDLSKLFSQFIMKLQNVNIINDTAFLSSIADALRKICNLSVTFGKFKETILTTTTIQIPQSSHETRVVIETVMDEIDCAMKYIQNFVEPSTDTGALPDAQLSADEQNIISKAVDTIHHWNTICDHGVTIAMSDNVDVKYITNASNTLKQNAFHLKMTTQNLKNKLKRYMRC